MAEVFDESQCPACPFPYADYFLSTRSMEESISCPFCGYFASADRVSEDEGGGFKETVVDVCLGAYGYESHRTYGSSPFKSEEQRTEMIAKLREPDNGLVAAWYTEKRDDGFFHRVIVKGEPRYAYYENNNPEDGFGVREKEAMESEDTYRSDAGERMEDLPEDDLPF